MPIVTHEGTAVQHRQQIEGMHICISMRSSAGQCRRLVEQTCSTIAATSASISYLDKLLRSPLLSINQLPPSPAILP